MRPNIVMARATGIPVRLPTPPPDVDEPMLDPEEAETAVVALAGAVAAAEEETAVLELEKPNGPRHADPSRQTLRPRRPHSGHDHL